MILKEKTRFTFLLVGQTTDTPWLQAVQRALFSLGELTIVPESDAAAAIATCCYDLVLIDAGAVRRVAALMSRLHLVCPGSRAVVFTSSPTWQRAREAMRSGAVDYVRKSLDERELQSLIRAALSCPRRQANDGGYKDDQAQDPVRRQ